MEWISHGVTGVLVGNAILPPDERPHRPPVWWVVASLAPDWLGFMVHSLGEAHRGVMHSLYALPLLAGIFAFAARRFSGRPQVKLVRLWIAFAAVIATHSVLDLLTCYRYNPA